MREIIKALINTCSAVVGALLAVVLFVMMINIFSFKSKKPNKFARLMIELFIKLICIFVILGIPIVAARVVNLMLTDLFEMLPEWMNNSNDWLSEYQPLISNLLSAIGILLSFYFALFLYEKRLKVEIEEKRKIEEKKCVSNFFCLYKFFHLIGELNENYYLWLETVLSNDSVTEEDAINFELIKVRTGMHKLSFETA